MARTSAPVVATLALLACGGVASLLTGCQTAKSSSHANAGHVNSRCPLMPEHPIDKSVTVDYKGQKVAFCCDGCISEWDRLSDAQKDARLAKSK
jgi:hypothetical protein